MSFKLLGGGSDLQTIVSDINQNILELKVREVTQIVKDTSGNRRIIFGRLPDGSYGLVISKEGYDVVEVLQES